jgi:hypothetical protein
MQTARVATQRVAGLVLVAAAAMGRHGGDSTNDWDDEVTRLMKQTACP